MSSQVSNACCSLTRSRRCAELVLKMTTGSVLAVWLLVIAGAPHVLVLVAHPKDATSCDTVVLAGFCTPWSIRIINVSNLR